MYGWSDSDIGENNAAAIVSAVNEVARLSADRERADERWRTAELEVNELRRTLQMLRDRYRRVTFEYDVRAADADLRRILYEHDKRHAAVLDGLRGEEGR